MNPVDIEPGLREACPGLVLGLIHCRVVNGAGSSVLWEKIGKTVCEIEAGVGIDTVRTHPAIAATRTGYKTCGKDPNRYRPAAEALRRRVVRGKGLYRVNAVVDVLNLVSLRSGFSIGGFDADKVVGDLRCGIGRHDEPYDAIGRGPLNIEGLPVLRDDRGAIGTPTSDHERTKVTTDTDRFLMVFYGFEGASDLAEAGQNAVDLLREHAHASDIETTVVGG